MTDGLLTNLQGRLKAALLATRIEEGYDRQASHAEGRYVAYRLGLGENAGLLETPELAQAFSEAAVEAMLDVLRPDDLLALAGPAALGRAPLLDATERTGRDISPDMAEALGAAADSHAEADLLAATPDDETLDRAALRLAQAQAELTGLPVPASCAEIKLGHWRRQALIAAWRARPARAA
jgi:hypothetical protein